MKSMISQSCLSKILTLLMMIVSLKAQAQNALCRDVFLTALENHPSREVDYDWTTAIFLYGAELYAKEMGEDFSKKLDPYYDTLVMKIPTIRDPDKAALSLAASVRMTPSGKKIIEASREFFSSEPKNSLGVIDHVGSRGLLGSLYPSSVWADSLIMSSLNQYLIARTDGEKNTALSEARTILKAIKSTGTGLFSHAFYPELGWRFPQKFHWGRGNLWVALFLSEVGQGHEDFRSLLEEELKALKSLYVPGKGLRTLLDDPSSSFETSATALFGYALLKQRETGLQEDISEVLSKFVIENKFTGVSGPTTAFPFPYYYRSVVSQGEYPYGTGAFLLWCSQLISLSERRAR